MRMYKNKTVSVVMPAFNEEQGIGTTVRGFLNQQEVDKVIVVDNNSRDKTALIAKKAGACVIKENTHGYGHACIKGLKEADTDYVVLVESDDSFDPEDLPKFFAYCEEFDLVKGARSNKFMIEEDADWGWFLKWGNWFISLLMQVLYDGPSMVEAGGTYRIIKKKSLRKILPLLSRTDSAFLPDMVTIALRLNLSIVEIPVRYRTRRGVSKITGNRLKAFVTGLNMIKVIITNRIKKV